MEDSSSKYCSECKSKDGKSKRLYQSIQEAEEAGYKLTKSKGVGHRAYECISGNGWHVTSRNYQYLNEYNIQKTRETEAAKLGISTAELLRIQTQKLQNELAKQTQKLQNELAKTAAAKEKSESYISQKMNEYSEWKRKKLK